MGLSKIAEIRSRGVCAILRGGWRKGRLSSQLATRFPKTLEQ
jgi:hypothetical protein